MYGPSVMRSRGVAEIPGRVSLDVLDALLVGARCARPSIRRTVYRHVEPACPLRGRAQRAPTVLVAPHLQGKRVERGEKGDATLFAHPDNLLPCPPRPHRRKRGAASFPARWMPGSRLVPLDVARHRAADRRACAARPYSNRCAAPAGHDALRVSASPRFAPPRLRGSIQRRGGTSSPYAIALSVGGGIGRCRDRAAHQGPAENGTAAAAPRSSCATMIIRRVSSSGGGRPAPPR
jgi:hypothetical protein